MIRKHEREFGYQLPALRDLQRALVKESHVQITPEAAVFNGDRRLIYHGRIDNLYEDFGRARNAATTHELDDAIRVRRSRQTVGGGQCTRRRVLHLGPPMRGGWQGFAVTLSRCCGSQQQRANREPRASSPTRFFRLLRTSRGAPFRRKSPLRATSLLSFSTPARRATGQVKLRRSLCLPTATRRPTPIKSPPSRKVATCPRGCRSRTIRNLPTICG